MVKKLFLLFVLLPATAAYAQVQTIQTPPDDPGIIVEGKKQKRVCKKFPPPTGSRVGERRVCKTELQWQTEEANANRAMDRQLQNQDANRAQDFNEQNGLAQKLPR